MKTYVVKIDPKNPDKEIIAKAAQAIKTGKLVAFPTETVYGIAANFLNKAAIEKLYDVKGRPKNKPFTVHIADIKTIEAMGCLITKEALALVSRFWPGPLTIILKPESGNKIGFRIPANKAALELIKAAGVPIVAPSANLSGKNPPTSAQEVLKDLDGKIDMLLDSGPTDVGIESTVIDFSVNPPSILREGALKLKDLLDASSIKFV